MSHLGAMALLTLLISASGCMDSLVAFQVRRVTSLQVVRIQGDSFTMRVQCEVENPNRVSAQLDGIRFKVFSGDHLLGQGAVPGTVEAPAREMLTLQSLMSVRYRSLPADFPARVRSGKLDLTTHVSFTATSKLGALELNLRSRDQVAVAQAVEVAVRGSFQGPNIRVERIQPTGFDLRRTHLTVGLRANNPFAFAVGVQRGTFELYINGKLVGDAALKKRSVVAPGSSALLQVQLDADHGALGAALLTLLARDPKFRVKGTLWIDPIGGVTRLPIDVTADASVLDEL